MKSASLQKIKKSFIPILILAACLGILLSQSQFPNTQQTFVQGKEADARLHTEIIAETDQKRKSILRGIQWLRDFSKTDENLYYVFSDFVLLLHELSLNTSDPEISLLTKSYLRDSYTRAAPHLSRIFDKDQTGKWDFISTLRLSLLYNIEKDSFLQFYRSYLPKRNVRPYNRSFETALAKEDYDLLGDYIIDYSFLHYLLRDFPKLDISLPQDRFQEMIKRISELEFRYSIHSDPDDLYDQNYYVTHIAYVLTNYGEDPFPNSPLRTKLKTYLLELFKYVRQDADDMDLLAEFVHCLKYLGLGERDEVQEAENFLIQQQNPDGSWGTQEDFQGDPYDIMHPTWAVTTALHACSHCQ